MAALTSSPSLICANPSVSGTAGKESGAGTATPRSSRANCIGTPKPTDHCSLIRQASDGVSVIVTRSTSVAQYRPTKSFALGLPLLYSMAAADTELKATPSPNFSFNGRAHQKPPPTARRSSPAPC